MGESGSVLLADALAMLRALNGSSKEALGEGQLFVLTKAGLERMTAPGLAGGVPSNKLPFLLREVGAAVLT
jgi:hypothetical protein